MSEENEIKNDCKKPETETDVDGGFAWITLIGSFVMYMLVMGTIRAYGVLYTEMVEYYSSGSGNTAWIGSIAWLLMLSLGPVANALSKRFGFRKVTMIGGVFTGTGYFLSGFVKRMELMYLTFSLCGIGYGLSLLPCATIVNFYFKKRRALANGIVVSAAGTGVLIFPFLYTFLIEKYGLLGSLWIIGAIVSNICVAGCVFRQPFTLQKKLTRTRVPLEINICTNSNGPTSKKDSDEKRINNDNKKKRCGCGKLDFKLNLLKDPILTLYVVSFALAVCGIVNNAFLIPAHIKALGFDKTYVALGVSIAGGVEIIARVLWGWVADLKIVKRTYMFVGFMFVGGIFALITPLFKSFTYMTIYATVVAAFPASFLSLVPILTIEVVGMENLPSAYGIISFAMALTSLIIQPVCGWMEDSSGNWHSAFILTGSILLVAGFTVAVGPAIVRHYREFKNALAF